MTIILYVSKQSSLKQSRSYHVMKPPMLELGDIAPTTLLSTHVHPLHSCTRCNHHFVLKALPLCLLLYDRIRASIHMCMYTRTHTYNLATDRVQMYIQIHVHDKSQELENNTEQYTVDKGKLHYTT